MKETHTMKFYPSMKKFSFILLIMVFVFSSGILFAQPLEKATHIIVWDTIAPLGNNGDIRGKNKWKAVPTDLRTLEANPASAISDPSYSGREYRFRGDAAIEDNHLIALFPARTGKVVIYTKTDSKKKLELIPVQLKGKPSIITNCSILQNTGDETTLKISFSAAKGGENLDIVLSLGLTGIVSLKSADNVKGISIISRIDHAVVPSFIGDDLIYNPQQYPSLNKIYIPSENFFLGLLNGENDMLVVTWPGEKKEATLSIDADKGMQGFFKSFDLVNGSKYIFLSLLSAPGIWHKEKLKPSYLEKEITISWKKPFRAKWKTQLIEGRTTTTFAFKENKQELWRAVTGFYIFPVWFNKDKTIYRLSKKIPPKGDSIIYFTERKNTPISLLTPVDILKDSLGLEASDAILDVEGRKLRTHHRRGAAGVRRACTCGCTAAIEKVFKANDEVSKKEYVEGAVDDMVYFVRRHVARINEYQKFNNNLIKFLESFKKSSVKLKPFIESIMEITKELGDEYNVARENMKSLGYADQLALKTKAISKEKKPGNLVACRELCKRWRAMGGAQDDVLAQSHRITRKLFREAGYKCFDNANAARLAVQIRKMCRRCLRNPDSYEIWPDY